VGWTGVTDLARGSFVSTPSVALTSVANLLVLVFDCVVAYGGAWVDAVDVVDASADGVHFDESDAHVDDANCKEW